MEIVYEQGAYKRERGGVILRYQFLIVTLVVP